MDNCLKSTIYRMQQLRGFFASSDIYLGGSTARCLALPTMLEMPSDTDIFILGPRTMHTDALTYILLSIFDSVSFSFTDKYKIKAQYKLAKCETDTGRLYDIIFVDTDIDGLFNDTASDLSKIYFKLTYNDYQPLSIHSKSVDVVNTLQRHICTIDSTLATQEHIEKLIKVCVNNGIKPVINIG